MKETLLMLYLQGKSELTYFYKDERGIELVQVAIMTALLALASIAVLTAFGTDITSYYDAIRSKFMATQPTP